MDKAANVAQKFEGICVSDGVLKKVQSDERNKFWEIKTNLIKKYSFQMFHTQ